MRFLGGWAMGPRMPEIILLSWSRPNVHKYDIYVIYLHIWCICIQKYTHINMAISRPFFLWILHSIWDGIFFPIKTFGHRWRGCATTSPPLPTSTISATASRQGASPGQRWTWSSAASTIMRPGWPSIRPAFVRRLVSEHPPRPFWMLSLLLKG